MANSMLADYFESSPSKFWDSVRGGAEYTDYAFGLGQNGAALGRNLSLWRGDAVTAAKFGAISDSFGAAGGTLGAIRIVPQVEQLVTGKMFWKLEDGTWKVNDPISIAIGVLVLAGRVLSSVNWLHGRGTYDLGKYSKVLSDTSLRIWGVVTTLDTVQNIREGLADSMQLDANGNEVVDKDKFGYDVRRQKRFANIFCNCLDTIALPFDFGYFMSTPALGVLGSSVGTIAKSAFFAKEIWYYA